MCGTVADNGYKRGLLRIKRFHGKLEVGIQITSYQNHSRNIRQNIFISPFTKIYIHITKIYIYITKIYLYHHSQKYIFISPRYIFISPKYIFISPKYIYITIHHHQQHNPKTPALCDEASIRLITNMQELHFPCFFWSKQRFLMHLNYWSNVV